MSVSTPGTQLTELVLSASRRFAQHRIGTSALQVLAAEIAHAVGARRVQITLRPAPGRLNEALEAAFEAPGRAPAFVVFSRAIQLRGATYGHFNVEIARATGSPAETILALETVTNLLGQAAERAALEEQIRAQRRAAVEAESALAAVKLLARAGGIVAKLRGLAPAYAQRWMEEEAAQLKMPAVVLAERVIEYAQAAAEPEVQRAAPGRPRLRRTA